MQNILVTGAAGFIGYHTTVKLLKMGYGVIGLDNINNYYDPQLKVKRLEQCGISENNIIDNEMVHSNQYPDYHFIKLNIKDKEGILNLFNNNNFDIVIHLAAQPGARYSVDHPDTYIESNIYGFFNILEACRQSNIKHLVYASSSSVYGDKEHTPYSETDMVDSPVSLYGATKKSNELMAHAYSHLYKIPVTGLRFFTVYGPWGRPDMVYFKFTRAILDATPITIFNYGKLKRDFTYIDDIVQGVVDVMNIIPEGEILYRLFNIGNSDPVDLLNFIEKLENILNKQAKKEMLPMQQGDVLTTFADTTKLEEYCGYKPYTPLEKGLKKFVEWYLKTYNI